MLRSSNQVPFEDFNEEQLASELIEQIAHYSDGPSIDIDQFLNQDAKEELYKGIKEYQQKYSQHVLDYCTNHSMNLEDGVSNRQFFRRLFIRKIAELDNERNKKKFAGDIIERSNNPLTAVTTLEKLLEKDVAELYQLALEEEKNSYEYRNAVFANSITGYRGKKWTERPVGPIAGPSGCGKTTAAEATIKKMSESLTHTDEDGENYVATIDGGIARKTSQIRNLVIQAAINKGYTCITDLHEKSKFLEETKKHMKNAVFTTDFLLGIAIPETFSKNSRKLLMEINSKNLRQAKYFFAEVVGHDPSIFREVVETMGVSRALETKKFHRRKFNLNATDLCESKVYGKWGFWPGVLGSKTAKFFFRNIFPGGTVLEITNSLIRIRAENKQNQDLANNNQTWVRASKNEPAILVHKDIFAQWEAYRNNNPSSPLSLKHFIDQLKNAYPVIIKTEADSKLEEARVYCENIHALLEDENDRLTALLIELTEHTANELNNDRIRNIKQYQAEIQNLLQRLDRVNKQLSLVEQRRDSHPIADINAEINICIENIQKCFNTKKNKKFIQSVISALKCARDAVSAKENEDLPLETEENLEAEPKVASHPGGDLSIPLKQSFFQRHEDKIIFTTSIAATGAVLGLTIGCCLGVSMGVLGVIPTFGLSLLATPAAIAILGSIGMAAGYIAGFVVGVGVSIIWNYSDRKKVAQQSELEKSRPLSPSISSPASITSTLRNEKIKKAPLLVHSNGKDEENVTDHSPKPLRVSSNPAALHSTKKHDQKVIDANPNPSPYHPV